MHTVRWGRSVGVTSMLILLHRRDGLDMSIAQKNNITAALSRLSHSSRFSHTFSLLLAFSGGCETRHRPLYRAIAPTLPKLKCQPKLTALGSTNMT